MKRVLFLCTGNYYRSRFGEIFFNWHAEERKLPWKADSRGLALNPYNDGTISRYAVARLKHHGIPTDSYQRFPINVADQDFQISEHVVAMKGTEHRPLIEASFPSWLERVEFWEIHDLDCDGPENVLPRIERDVIGLIERLATKKVVGLMGKK